MRALLGPSLAARIRPTLKSVVRPCVGSATARRTMTAPLMPTRTTSMSSQCARPMAQQYDRSDYLGHGHAGIRRPDLCRANPRPRAVPPPQASTSRPAGAPAATNCLSPSPRPIRRLPRQAASPKSATAHNRAARQARRAASGLLSSEGQRRDRTTVSIADSGNHQYAVGIVLRKSGDDVLEVTASAGNNVAAGTSCTFGGVTTTGDDQMVVTFVGTDRDNAGPSFSSEANASLGNLTERHDAGTTQGAAAVSRSIPARSRRRGQAATRPPRRRRARPIAGSRCPLPMRWRSVKPPALWPRPRAVQTRAVWRVSSLLRALSLRLKADRMRRPCPALSRSSGRWLPRKAAQMWPPYRARLPILPLPERWRPARSGRHFQHCRDRSGFGTLSATESGATLPTSSASFLSSGARKRGGWGRRGERQRHRGGGWRAGCQ